MYMNKVFGRLLYVLIIFGGIIMFFKAEQYFLDLRYEQYVAFQESEND